jgi:hypothetical protein
VPGADELALAVRVPSVPVLAALPSGVVRPVMMAFVLVEPADVVPRGAGALAARVGFLVVLTSILPPDTSQGRGHLIPAG